MPSPCRPMASMPTCWRRCKGSPIFARRAPNTVALRKSPAMWPAPPSPALPANERLRPQMDDEMTRTEWAAHFRKRLKHEGIKAKCRCDPHWNFIYINVPQFGSEFTEHEQRTIRLIAHANRFTMARGQPIDIERMTNPHTFTFE